MRPVGSTARANVRLIAAAHRDVEAMKYRLRRVVLEVPPLRARRGVARPALVALDHVAWPGKVRELEALVEQAMIFRGSGWVTLDDLDLRHG